MDSILQARRRSPAPLWISLLAVLVVLLVSIAVAAARLTAQGQPETIGRIAGDDIAVRGAISVEVENGRSSTLLSSGSDVTVRSGQARVLLADGGEIGICGPAHFSLLKSGGAVTVALDYGRIHVHMENNTVLTAYTPLIVAAPVAISEAGRDATIGLEPTGEMCVRAARGAVRIEQQLTGQVLLVPQSGEITFAGGQLESVLGVAGTCDCEVVLAKAGQLEGPRPPELSVPVAADLARPAKPPSKTSNPDKPADPNQPTVEEPIYKIMMPALAYNAGSPSPPDPGPETMVLMREVRVRPSLVFTGRVEDPSPTTPGAEVAQGSPSPQEAAPKKEHPGFGSRVRGFFRRLFGRPPCSGAGCGASGD